MSGKVDPEYIQPYIPRSREKMPNIGHFLGGSRKKGKYSILLEKKKKMVAIQ